MYLWSKVHSQDLGFWSKHLLTLLLFLQETPQALSIFRPFDPLVTQHNRLSKWKYQLNSSLPSPSTCTMLVDEKKNNERWYKKYLIVKSDSTEPEMGERNLIVPLLTHVFSIDGWFSSVFVITISGSIPPSRTVIPFVGYPFPVRFLPPTHLLATLTWLHVRNSSTGGQSRFGRRKKMKWKPVRLLCVKLKRLVRRGQNSLSARVRHLKNIGDWIFLLFLSWSFLLTKH